MLYESLVGQCEYTTQTKGSFWCHVNDTKGAILLVIPLNKFVLVLFHSHLGILFNKFVLVLLHSHLGMW